MKYNVYEAEYEDGSKTLFSDGVKREFGENHVIFVEGHQIFCSVMPLKIDPSDHDNVKNIGYIRQLKK